MRRLELLAPAKNLACGIAAIDCGADAVYIGAPKFGARAAAGNSFDDIAALVAYAHQFGAKVFVTLNTIIYDDELAEARATFAKVSALGVDAVLIQDLALLADSQQQKQSESIVNSESSIVNSKSLNSKSSNSKSAINCRLHASTQTDNRNKEKVAWLKSLGFSRVVLARELTLDEILAIHEAHPDFELEAFVHGALCVSYSGACYASQHCFSRSANRGECAQFCRMKFDLLDADGNVIERQRHLLSLKDLCQIDRLEQMADAGIVSFKIEGRLKDESYVRNVVAAYSQRLDELCRRRPDDYARASAGKVVYAFEPNLKKTFNRGYTHYFLDGRKPDIFSPDTPKAIGEFVGKVKEISGRSFNVAGTAVFANGDGLCFVNDKKELEGFRVNRVEGNRLFPLVLPQGLRPGMPLYRNNDVAFEKMLHQQGTARKLLLQLLFSITPDGFALAATTKRSSGDAKNTDIVTVETTFAHQPAEKPQRENIIRQLSKWGGTIYEAERIDIQPEAESLFVPSSIISGLRQALAEQLRLQSPLPDGGAEPRPTAAAPVPLRGDIAKNVANADARQFYRDHGVTDIVEACELGGNRGDSLPLMQCRHCLRFSLGYCTKRPTAKAMPWKMPLRLRLGDGRQFLLEFDCKNCQMNVWPMK